MGHASRSTRGQVKTKNLSAIGSEDRLFERKPNKPSIHIDIVEQPNVKVRRLFFLPSTSPQGLNAELLVCLRSGSGMYGNSKSIRCVRQLLLFFHWSPMRMMISVLTRTSRSNAMAFLNSISRTSSSSTSQKKGARQRCVRIVNTTKLSLRHTGTRAGGR
jgi:hypothetical protein